MKIKQFLWHISSFFMLAAASIVSAMEMSDKDQERWNPKDYDTYTYKIPTLIIGYNKSEELVQVFFTPKEDEINLKKVGERGESLKLVAEIQPKSNYVIHKDLILTTHIHKNKNDCGQIASGPLFVMAPKEFKSSWAVAVELANIENPTLEDFKTTCKKHACPLNMSCAEADIKQVYKQLVQTHNDCRTVQNTRPRIYINEYQSNYIIHRLEFIPPEHTTCLCIPYHPIHEINTCYEHNQTGLFYDKRHHQNTQICNMIPVFPPLLIQGKKSTLSRFSNMIDSNHCLLIQLPFDQRAKGTKQTHLSTSYKVLSYHRWLMPNYKKLTLKQFNEYKKMADELQKEHAQALEKFNDEIVLNEHRNKENPSEQARRIAWITNHPQQFDLNHLATFAESRKRTAQITSILKNYKTLQLVRFITQDNADAQAKIADIESQAIHNYHQKTKTFQNKWRPL